MPRVSATEYGGKGLTWLSGPRAVVVRTKRKNLLARCISHVSEKFKRIGNQYNIGTVFKTKHTLRSSLARTRPERDPQQTAHCIYSISCECGRCYIGETGRPLAVRIREHKHNLNEGLLDKSKLAQHAYEEGHRYAGTKLGF
jgi:hypothetical protein